MEISSLFDNNAFFRSKSKIKEWIKNSKNYKGEDPRSAKLFMFFSTSKQRAYLVATERRLYCILDDSRKDYPHINWSMPKRDVKDRNGLKITITSRDKSEKTGLVDISDKHKNWLYTKNLFSSKNIESSMAEFIENAM